MPLFRRALLLVMFMTVGAIFPHAAYAQSLCFDAPEIDNCIDGRFLEYWQQHGGLAVFGYPTSAAGTEQTADGSFLTQYFERNRFELHPGVAAPYDVLLGRLGDSRLQQQGRNWFTFPKANPDTPHYFASTQHAIAHEPFWQFWSQHGLEFDNAPGFSEAESVALFGAPLSEPQLETTTTGEQVLTQWFERARFEDHGTRGVLLGLLGNEIRAPLAPTPTPEPVPAKPTCADPPPSLYGTISPTCVFGGEMLTGVADGFKPGEVVGFFVTGPDNSVFEFPVYAGDAVADEYGKYHIRGALERYALAGNYALTLKGDKSKRVAVLNFAIKPLDLQADPPFDFSVIPAGQDARVTPPSGKRGVARFRFELSGFLGEHAGVYATLPNGEVIGAPFTLKLDGAGQPDKSFRFVPGQDLPVGIVAITFEGHSSGRKAIAYVRLQP